MTLSSYLNRFHDHIDNSQVFDTEQKPFCLSFHVESCVPDSAKKKETCVALTSNLSSASLQLLMVQYLTHLQFSFFGFSDGRGKGVAHHVWLCKVNSTI